MMIQKCFFSFTLKDKTNPKSKIRIHYWDSGQRNIISDKSDIIKIQQVIHYIKAKVWPNFFKLYALLKKFQKSIFLRIDDISS